MYRRYLRPDDPGGDLPRTTQGRLSANSNHLESSEQDTTQRIEMDQVFLFPDFFDPPQSCEFEEAEEKEEEEEEEQEQEEEEQDEEQYAQFSPESDLENMLDGSKEDLTAGNGLINKILDSATDQTRPVFHNCPINEFESLLCCWAYSLKYNTSNSSFASLISLLRLHFPMNNEFVHSIYDIRQKFNLQSSSLFEKHYCDKCFSTEIGLVFFVISIYLSIDLYPHLQHTTAAWIFPFFFSSPHLRK
eukprot:Pompholyxophrys_punicea_v1_NODE_47_length_4460_cov_14.923496.p1 type:complete len:246 gc:universal NODE_47_length_4460_cov_14.923496:1952-1215(-)